VNTARPVTAKQ